MRRSARRWCGRRSRVCSKVANIGAESPERVDLPTRVPCYIGAMALSASARPIAGAVATLGVSDRIAFLRRTYVHLGVALLLWAAMTAGIFRYASDFSLSFSRWAMQGR